MEHLTPETYLAYLPAELEPVLLGEDGAQVPEEALHALLAILRHAPGTQHRQLHVALDLYLEPGEKMNQGKQFCFYSKGAPIVFFCCALYCPRSFISYLNAEKNVKLYFDYGFLCCRFIV